MIDLAKKKKKLKVFIGIPNLSDTDHYRSFYSSVINHVKAQKCPVEMMEPYKTPPYFGSYRQGDKSKLRAITDRLNKVIDEFMLTDASHLWIVDGDVQVPTHALCSLLGLNVDIASGLYAFHNDKYMMMFGRMPDEETYNFAPRDYRVFKNQILGEDFRVGGGNGCMLIRRRVFKRYHPYIKPLRFICPEGRGSDVYFWYLAQKAGFTARIHGGVLAGHLPEWPLISYEDDLK